MRVSEPMIAVTAVWHGRTVGCANRCAERVSSSTRAALQASVASRFAESAAQFSGGREGHRHRRVRWTFHSGGVQPDECR